MIRLCKELGFTKVVVCIAGGLKDIAARYVLSESVRMEIGFVSGFRVLLNNFPRWFQYITFV